MTRHLDLIQRYAGTSGHCHLWAEAILRVVGQGRIVELVAVEPWTFEQHDWPESERLVLHDLVELEDGRLVDAEGLHERNEMLAKFGLRPGDRHLFEPCIREAAALARWEPAVSCREESLLALGWDEAVPVYDGELLAFWKETATRALESGIPEPSADDYHPHMM
jgi:hypothetical protein